MVAPWKLDALKTSICPVKTKCVEEKNCKSDLKEFAVALRDDKHVYVCKF